uniref:Uncharacterized protein n=1 Tax=Coccidioides posadasii RMSCC 3488 TaxID=454284 RepID=A0A0J6FCW1_COCPO|nr:hypothetical protein CPAG_07225 [Coccidioides posadasii RMSCC 3488]
MTLPTPREGEGLPKVLKGRNAVKDSTKRYYRSHHALRTPTGKNTLVPCTEALTPPKCSLMNRYLHGLGRNWGVHLTESDTKVPEPRFELE